MTPNILRISSTWRLIFRSILSLSFSSSHIRSVSRADYTFNYKFYLFWSEWIELFNLSSMAFFLRLDFFLEWSSSYLILAILFFAIISIYKFSIAIICLFIFRLTWSICYWLVWKVSCSLLLYLILFSMFCILYFRDSWYCSFLL